jgi:hypothetical protein
MAEYGTISWPTSNPLWQFSYSLGDYSQPEGLVIRNVRYRGRLMLYKASLPSLRVQYDGPCGPYKDPLTFNNADVQPNGRRVAVYDYSIFGFRWLALESYHRIGSYRLRQRWTFLPDGTLAPQLFSAGLQCNDDHRHHAYWRFDFDINGASDDAIYEYNTTTPDIGYGPGWHKKLWETTRLKSPATNRRWAVMDRTQGNGCFLIPDPNDGSADAFSTRDVWFMRYRGSEDLNGNQGTAGADGLDAYLDFENLDGTDVVAWYCGHLGHHAHDGGDEWHATGPRIVPFRW